MKNLFKTVAVTLAVAVTALSFAGCGDNSGSTSGTLKIGGIGPLTGAAATYGTAVKNGAQLAVDEINTAGGVNGMKLELNFQDDEHNAEKSINAYNVLKDNGMQILLGTVTTTPCLAVTELATNDNTYMITPSASAVDCIAGDNAFRICFSDPDQGTASAKYIGENKVASKVAVIYDSSDAYSSGIYNKFKAEAATQNISVVSEQTFTSSNNTDFSVAISKIKTSGAELVFLPIYYQQAALILNQSKQAGLNVKFFGCDGLDGVIGQLGNDKALADGVMLLTPFAADAQDEKTQTFVKAYKAANNNEDPNQFAADGYDAVYTIKAALEEAGVKDATLSASEICDLMKAAMTKITVDGVTGKMTWNAAGEPTKDAKAMEIKNGSYVAVK